MERSFKTLGTLDKIFVCYCCTIGIVGNLMTCVLFKRRINRFKFYLESKRMALVRADARLRKPRSSADRLLGTLHVDKCILLDYRHNWNLYLYMIGVNIFDLIILLNWIISLVSVNVGFRSRMAYDTYEDIDDTVMNSSRLFKDDYDSLRMAMTTGNGSIHPDVNIDYSQPFGSLLHQLDQQYRYFIVNYISDLGLVMHHAI